MSPDPSNAAAYISVSATKTLIHDSLEARSARLAADDMLSTDDAAVLTGISESTVGAWIAEGRCIGLSHPDGRMRLPKWQFALGFLPVVPKLTKALGTTDGWALLAFLESPHGALQGATPRAAIERGQAERVLDIAGSEA